MSRKRAEVLEETSSTQSFLTLTKWLGCLIKSFENHASLTTYSVIRAPKIFIFLGDKLCVAKFEGAQMKV